MRYEYREEIKLEVDPYSWDKTSGKEILQYAVGGLLYTPGTNVKIANDIIENRFTNMKSIVLCLEDAIGDDVVSKAEKCVKRTLGELYSAYEKDKISISDIPLIFIRVREVGQMQRLYELCGRRLFSMLTGFNLPKFDTENCDDYISEFTELIKNCDTHLYIMPIFESKDIMYKQLRMDNLMYINDKLKLISDNVLNIRVGATDFSNIFGIRRDCESTVYDMRVISDCLADVINVFGRNYVCSAAVWEYFGEDPEGDWLLGLKKELRMDKLNGFVGKTCIHPTQLPYVQEGCIVSYENYRDAVNILGMSDGMIGVKKGFGDNKMNEVKAHSNWAKKIIGMSHVYGVLAE